MIAKASSGEDVWTQCRSTHGCAEDRGPWEPRETPSPCTACPQTLFLLTLSRSALSPPLYPTVSASALFVLFLLNSYPAPPHLHPSLQSTTQGPKGSLCRVDLPCLGTPAALEPLSLVASSCLWHPYPSPDLHAPVFLHTIPATPSCWQLYKLALLPPAPGTLHMLFPLSEYSSSPPQPWAPVYQIFASQGLVGRPLTKSLRGGFHSPTLTVTCPGPDDSLADRSGHRPLARAQRDCSPSLPG